jgi:hypothetical protein
MLLDAVGPEQVMSTGILNVVESSAGAFAGSYAVTPTRLLWCYERDIRPSVEGFGYWQVRAFRLLKRGLASDLEVAFDDQILRLTLTPWDGAGPKEPTPILDYLMAALTAQGAQRLDAAPMPGPVWGRQVAFGVAIAKGTDEHDNEDS